MAFATHLTLATRHTLLLGEGEERIDERQRVSVSVTYELERGDTDVPLLATVLASEVAQAHRAAAEVLRAHAFCPHQTSPMPHPASAHSPQTGMEKNGSENGVSEGSSGEDEDPLRPEDPDEGCPAVERTEEEAPPDDEEEPYGCSEVPSPGHWIAGAGTRSNAVPPSGPPPTGGEPSSGPLITATKRLAIQSLVHKLGLTPPEFSDLLRRTFGTWSLHLLTKDQGQALHLALQDRLKEKQQGEKQQGKSEPLVAAPTAGLSTPYRTAAGYNGRTAKAPTQVAGRE